MHNRLSKAVDIATSVTIIIIKVITVVFASYVLLWVAYSFEILNQDAIVPGVVAVLILATAISFYITEALAARIAIHPSRKDDFEFYNDVERFSDRVHELEFELHTLRREVYDYFTQLGLSVDPQSIRMKRYTTMSAYLETNDDFNGEEISNSMKHLATTYGFEVIEDCEPEISSWFKKLGIRTRDVLTSAEFRELMQQMEQAAQMKAIEQPLAIIDREKAESVVALIASLDRVSSATIQVGSLFIVKSEDKDNGTQLTIRTMTGQQLREFNADPKNSIKAEFLDQPSSEVKLIKRGLPKVDD